ncbi:MAG: hypothetical protein WBP31_14210 [Chitinophagales bacterium]|jgi:hypothetical protein
MKTIFLSIFFQSHFYASGNVANIDPIILDTISISCNVYASTNFKLSDTGPMPNIYFVVDSLFKKKIFSKFDVYQSANGLIVDNITINETEYKNGFTKLKPNSIIHKNISTTNNQFNSTHVNGKFIRCLISCSDMTKITSPKADKYFTKCLNKFEVKSTYFLVYIPI